MLEAPRQLLTATGVNKKAARQRVLEPQKKTNSARSDKNIPLTIICQLQLNDKIKIYTTNAESLHQHEFLYIYFVVSCLLSLRRNAMYFEELLRFYVIYLQLYNYTQIQIPTYRQSVIIQVVQVYSNAKQNILQAFEANYDLAKYGVKLFQQLR